MCLGIPLAILPTCSMNPETAVTCNRGYFNQEFFAVWILLITEKVVRPKPDQPDRLLRLRLVNMYQVSYLEIFGTHSTNGIHKYLEIQQEVDRSCVFTYSLTTKPGFWSMSSSSCLCKCIKKKRSSSIYL